MSRGLRGVSFAAAADGCGSLIPISTLRRMSVSDDGGSGVAAGLGSDRRGEGDFLGFGSLPSSLDELLFRFLLSINSDLRRPPSSGGGAGLALGEGLNEGGGGVAAACGVGMRMGGVGQAAGGKTSGEV